MRNLITAAMILAAGSVYGIGVGLGGFGGVSLPLGDMAADRNVFYQYTGTGGQVGFEGGEMKAAVKLGTRALVAVLPYLEIEGGFAYHLNYPQQDWDVPSFDEPTYRIIPITVGANYVYRHGPTAFYAGGGAGYYLAKGTLSATFNLPPYGDVEFSGDMTANNLGFYGGGGFRYHFGNFSLDAGPRFHYVPNEGTYDVDMKYGIGPFGGSVPFEVEKGFNDTFVDVVVGVNYYFI
ncbi:MAG: hypothetical protein PVH29_01705 [Candidatus Zixiibacteriota bacterium]|jgi:hypothetical protein